MTKRFRITLVVLLAAILVAVVAVVVSINVTAQAQSQAEYEACLEGLGVDPDAVPADDFDVEFAARAAERCAD